MPSPPLQTGRGTQARRAVEIFAEHGFVILRSVLSPIGIHLWLGMPQLCGIMLNRLCDDYVNITHIFLPTDIIRTP